MLSVKDYLAVYDKEQGMEEHKNFHLVLSGEGKPNIFIGSSGALNLRFSETLPKSWHPSDFIF